MKKITKRLQHSVFFGWFICLLGALFYTYEYLLRIEPGIMVKDLQHNFSLGAGGIGLLVSAYYWAYTPLQLVVGLVLDRFGARRTLLTALLTCILGTFIFGLTKNIWIAGFGRFLIGIGSAFAFVGSLKLAADWLPSKYFSFFAGLCTSLGMLGAIFGETAMSSIVDHLGWHPVITDSLWLGLILIGIFYLFVFEKAEAKEFSALEKTQNFKTILDAVFKIIRSKNMLQVGFVGCALYLSLSVFAEQWGNSYIQKILAVNTEAASYYIDMIFFGWLVGSPIQGLLSEKMQSRRIALIAGCLLSFLCILPIIICPTFLPHWLLATLLFLFAFFCSSEINCFAVAHDSVDNKLTATAVGLMNACIMVGGMIVQPFFALGLEFFARQFPSENTLYHYTIADYQAALMIVPIFLIIALLIACSTKETYR